MGSSGGGSAGQAAKTINKISTAGAKNAQTAIGNLAGQDLGSKYSPIFQNIADQQYAWTQSPSAQQMQAGANVASNMGAQTANDAFNYAHSMVPYGQSLMNYGSKVQDMGLDPRNELYDRTLQKTQEQQRVSQAARGIAMSPYGAGLEGDATRNFNIDWQNQQLDRATKAGESARTLGESANTIGTGAFNLGSGATDLYASSSALPYKTGQGLYGDQANAYSAVGGEVAGANQNLQQAISDWLQSAGLGSSYTNAASGAKNASTSETTGLASIPLSLIGKH